MNATTQRLQEMLAANATSATPDDPEMIAGEIGMQPHHASHLESAPRRTRVGDPVVLDGEWAAAHHWLCTGRGPTGRLRNFGAMGTAKFNTTYESVIAEDNDPEAIDALVMEAQARRDT